MNTETIVLSKPEEPEVITRDQATVLVGNQMLLTLEGIIEAHEAVLSDDAASAARKENARTVIATCRGFGQPLFDVVRLARKPRILRPERSRFKVVR